MKRHPSLEPFSRDHNDGLILARKLSQDGASALEGARQAWRGELQDHFAEEERLLGPLTPGALRVRLRQEHETIESLILGAASDEEARRLGNLLHDHIRWEERELFAVIEECASPASLTALGHAAAPLERRRGKSNPRRADLVARRTSDPAKEADLAYLSEVAKTSGPQWGMETEDLNATLLTWSEGEGVQEHVNDEVDVLVVVVSGEILLKVAEREMLLKAGQLAAIPKGSVRSLRAISPRATHLNIHKRRRKLMPGLPPAR